MERRIKSWAAAVPHEFFLRLPPGATGKRCSPDLPGPGGRRPRWSPILTNVEPAEPRRVLDAMRLYWPEEVSDRYAVIYTGPKGDFLTEIVIIDTTLDELELPRSRQLVDDKLPLRSWQEFQRERRVLRQLASRERRGRELKSKLSSDGRKKEADKGMLCLLREADECLSKVLVLVERGRNPKTKEEARELLWNARAKIEVASAKYTRCL